MSSRREFMRDTLMAFAVSLLPKTLLPQELPAEITKKQTTKYFLVTQEMLDDTGYIKDVLEKRFSYYEIVPETHPYRNIRTLKVEENKTWKRVIK